jgi:hypothetical protein
MNIKSKIMRETIKKVNVAPSSDEGHYVTNARQVIELDKESTESFLVIGESKLVTKNHTTININEDCLINTQVVYNPFSKMFEKSKD